MSSRRMARAGVFAVPLIALGFTFASGCGDDEPAPVVESDASTDVPVIDAQQQDVNTPPSEDSGSDAEPSEDAGTEDASDDAGDDAGSDDAGSEDAGIEDAGIEDASPDADPDPEPDASAPGPLCETYPNEVIDSAGDPMEEPSLPRWTFIARRALYTLTPTNARSACEVGAHFMDTSGPDQAECLGNQLAVLTGCPDPATYEDSVDGTGTQCVGPDGVVQLGFRNPQNGGYHKADIDFVIELVRQSAISTGMAAEDADRLKALLEENRHLALTMDAGADAGEGGYSNSTCP